MRYLLALVLLGTACAQKNAGVCCTTDADCDDFGLPRGSSCGDGFACEGHLCTEASCLADTDCPAAQPVCGLDDKVCGACEADNDCAWISATPYCDITSGACRACVIDAHCPPSSPVCSSGTCRACALDFECPSMVCDVDTGACLAANDVFYASAAGSDTAPCTQTQPCSIAHALVLAAVDPSQSTIRMLPGTYGTSLTISTGTVTLVGTGAQLQGANSAKVLLVNGGANATVRGLDFDLTRQDILCDGTAATSALTLRDMTITAIPNALIVTKCTTTLRRVNIVSNSFAMVLGDDAVVDADQLRVTGTGLGAAISTSSKRMTLKVVNSLLDNTMISFQPTDDMTSKSHLVVAYTTIFLTNAATALNGCTIGANMNKTTLVENNIIVGKPGGNAIDGAFCAMAHNVIFPQSIAIPGGNSIADPMFVDAANHVFELRAGSPAIDAAVSSVGLDPNHDLAGTSRPQGPRPDIGALEFKP